MADKDCLDCRHLKKQGCDTWCEYGEAWTPLNRKDYVKVVRCKDCKYYNQNPYGDDGEMICRCWSDWLHTDPDDFCSSGEKRND